MSSRTTSPRAADGRNMVATALLCAGAIFAPLAAHTQPLSGNGYLFHRPSGSISVRGGYTRPSGSSDLFSFAREQLTLDRGDFGGAAVGADIGFRIADRLSLQFNGGYSQRMANSEMRDWVDTDDKPIEQTTSFTRAPFMAGLRYDITAPGRRIGKLAYVPSRVIPYATAGAGVMWYKFKQEGAFVDYKTLDVFNTTLESSGSSFAGYGALGADFGITPLLAITTEARYDMARAPLSRSSFSGFKNIDLSGLSATIGFTFRY